MPRAGQKGEVSEKENRPNRERGHGDGKCLDGGGEIPRRDGNRGGVVELYGAGRGVFLGKAGGENLGSGDDEAVRPRARRNRDGCRILSERGPDRGDEFHCGGDSDEFGNRGAAGADRISRNRAGSVAKYGGEDRSVGGIPVEQRADEIGGSDDKEGKTEGAGG